MKYLKTIFGLIILSSMLFTSCSVKPTEIDVSKLETVCDHVDALEKVCNAMEKLKPTPGVTNGKVFDSIFQDKDSPEAVYLEQLLLKHREIKEILNKKFTKIERRSCEKYEWAYTYVKENF